MDIHPLIRHAPDPDHEGWWSWDLPDDGRFHTVVGKLLVREDGAGRGVCRMFPEAGHTNLGGIVHGGAILTFIDMSLFAGATVAGASVASGVTLDCNVRFLSPGRAGAPLDAEVEVLRETRRLAFIQGRVMQEGDIVAAFSGALRKQEPRA